MTSIPDARQRSVLVVEGDANALHLMRDYLTRANFRVRSASDGWEALKRLKDGPVDLIVTEHAIVDMDGARLREKCMMNPVTREIPFLYLVEGGQTESHVRALRSGVDDCITKPFDPVILVARVQAVLERRRSYEEMVRVDPLTRLLNRPALEKELEEELLRAARYKREASLVMLDVDSFSIVNEDGGVAMGDLLLTCLAGVILTSIRAMDTAGRHQGGKFILFLPETNRAGAAILTRRIQQQLATIATAVAGIELTFSASIVGLPEDGGDLDTLLPRLEQALNQAKAESGPGSVYQWGIGLAPAEESAGA
ncbi:MAG: diguanylate cyclase [Candidatus Hydrogenedentes bacterium]|nr:diguanylate cyclase [Candidatus Hydrogenedentota bacterium]